MAGYEEFIGSVSDFAGNYEPQNYAFCAGQIMQIQQNAALFSILGTTYGGDGVRTFALPDLRPKIDGQKVWWWQTDEPTPSKVICIQGAYPPRQ